MLVAMARNALILGLLSILFAGLGFVMFAVPVLGTVLRIGAPILGLLGIIMGGKALQSNGDAGDSNGSAMALGGLATSILGFLIGLVVFVACSATSCAAGAVGDAMESANEQQAQPVAAPEQ
ncbi:MAG: hypothetical protein ACI9KE_003050 [Polyangiales bacterium]|jgi:hypothetical protein